MSHNASKNRVRITVTEQDIAAGKPTDIARCPIALAARRALRVPCLVGVEWITTTGRSDYRRLQMSRDAARRLTMFDQTGKMSPFTFEAEDITP